MDDAVLKHANRPVEQRRQRTRHGEVKAGQLAPEDIHVERRRGRTGRDALLSPGQLASQVIIDPLSLGPGRKQRFACVANRGGIRRTPASCFLPQPNAPSSASHSKSICEPFDR